MALKPSFDPGLTSKYMGALLRAINKDGSFNVRRKGFRKWAGSAYLRLVTMTWPRFLTVVTLYYLAANTVFAWIYQLIGEDTLHVTERDLGLSGFARAFFFSAQTLTTVGYGSVYPFGMAAHLVAALEGAIGLMGFALATGLLFARFSRPSARLVFSERALMAPLRDGTQSLQFRIANERSNVLMEVEAAVMLMTVERGANGALQRNFVELALERKRIFFLALTWTVVHPIDETSPLWGKTGEDLKNMQAELLILIKCFDDAFSQVVHRRYSYTFDEIEWSARFATVFEVTAAGHLELDLERVGAIEKIAVEEV